MARFGDLLDLAGRALLGVTFAWWGSLKLVETLGIAGRPDGGGWKTYMEAAGVTSRSKFSFLSSRTVPEAIRRSP